MNKVWIIPLLILTACTHKPVPAPQVTLTVTPLPFATATLAPTFTLRPSLTVAPPTIAPTIVPISADLTTQVNVRSGPDTSAKVLGVLNYGNRVQIIGKDRGASWWQIIYPQNSGSTGWVAAAFVQVSEVDSAKIPVVQPQASNPTQQPSTPNDTLLPQEIKPTLQSIVHTARVKNQIFIRVGPGQTFATLGTINTGTVVTMLGRNLNNVWVQIQYDGSTDGKGWVASAYLEGADLSGLPYFDNQGIMISQGTPVPNPGQPTLTATAYAPASADKDTEQNPAVNIIFSPDGAREFTYSSDLSSPNGDPTDWVAFTPYEPTNQSTYLYFKLACTGNGGITATLEKDGIPVPELKPLVCGNYDFAIQVQGGKKYILVLNADGSGGQLRYSQYTLYISSTP